jgi:hypothetical protein
MKTSGRSAGGSFALVFSLAMLGSPHMTAAETTKEPAWNEEVPIPPDAVYLGGDMGGDFVKLEQIQIALAPGESLPAYQMEIYAAFSNGADYGVERIGGYTFRGVGLYVPPDFVAGTEEGYAPPSVAYILGLDGGSPRASMNGGVLWVSLPHDPDTPEGFWLARIIPLHLQ